MKVFSSNFRLLTETSIAPVDLEPIKGDEGSGPLQIWLLSEACFFFHRSLSDPPGLSSLLVLSYARAAFQITANESPNNKKRKRLFNLTWILLLQK